jgi:hypothetical protein
LKQILFLKIAIISFELYDDRIFPIFQAFFLMDLCLYDEGGNMLSSVWQSEPIYQDYSVKTVKNTILAFILVISITAKFLCQKNILTQAHAIYRYKLCYCLFLLHELQVAGAVLQ